MDNPCAELYRESTRAARVERRKELGDYYRDLARDYDYLWNLKLSFVWPTKPNIPQFEND